MLGLLGGVLTLQGSILLAVMLATSHGGPLLADYQLDSGGASTEGRVEAVDAVGGQQQSIRIRYRFRIASSPITGESFTAPPSRLTANSPCTVEFLAEDPAISRVQGTDALHFDPELWLVTQLLLVPGGLGFLFWLRGVMRMRVALREGTLVTAQVIENKLRKHLNPSQVRLSYRFRDAHEVETIHGHWVRASSEFGKWLTAEQPRHVEVIYDPDRPTVSRAIAPGDFLDDMEPAQ